MRVATFIAAALVVCGVQAEDAYQVCVCSIHGVLLSFPLIHLRVLSLRTGLLRRHAQQGRHRHLRDGGAAGAMHHAPAGEVELVAVQDAGAHQGYPLAGWLLLVVEGGWWPVH